MTDATLRPRTGRHPFVLAFIAQAIALCLLSACASKPLVVTQSPNDDRHYAYMVLDNGLAVLLVSDASADRSAAALVVRSGQFSDPPDRGGLAHFLEHMLFLGTEKYPETDAYQRFISTHGGSHNAYTSADHTNYFFDIRPDRFEGALDRFAQFFIAPRLDADYVEREKNAVDSEFQLYRNDDGWRGFHVNKQLFNPAHPGSRFAVGTLDTLAGDVRTALVRFYEEHYSADRMSLVVLGPQSLDELRDWVTRKFSPIPRRGPAVDPVLPPLYAPGTLPAELAYRTIKDLYELNFNFPVPALDRWYRQKPGEFVANLLGHEGEGSLHAWLMARGWIESLAASAQRFDAENGVVTLALELTPTGAQHVAEIEQAVFDYVDLVREQGLERWRYEEQAKIAELAFRFEEKRSPQSTVYRLAPNMRLYPPGDLLVAPYLMTEWDEPLVRRYLDALRRDNVLVEVARRDVDGDKVEPWFDVSYRVTPLAPDRTPDAATAGLALPGPNPFLPERLDLIGAFDEKPKRLAGQPGLTVWLARDTSFGVPRANTIIEIALEGGLETLSDAVNANLYARLVEDRLNAFAYPARIAGLDYRVAASPRGFRITITGFDDKQPALLETLLDTFAGLAITEERVVLYRDALRRELENAASERPYQQATAAVGHLLVEGAWSPAALASALTGATRDGLESWQKTRLARAAATVLLHGNADEATAARVSHILTRHLNLAALPAFEPRVERPDATLRHGLTIDNPDASLVLYLQGREPTISERARFGLAGQILSAPFFNELRTEQQLGYVVFAGPAVLRRTPGLSFTVQSPVAGPDALFAATTAFMTRFRTAIASMPAAEFSAHQQSLVARLLERDKNLGERGSRYWSDLELGFTEFDSREQIAAAVAAADPTSFLAFYDELLAQAAAQRLVVYSSGRFGTAPEGTEVAELDAWRVRISPVESPAGTPAAPPAASVRIAR